LAIAVEPEQLRAHDQIHPAHALAAIGSLGWLAVAGAASLGAGAIHAAAIGVHSEHHQAVVTFTIVAAIQLGFGAVALARPGRIVLALGALANAGFLVGWQMAKTSGISFIDGLGEVEPRQFTDTLAASLAALAVVAVLIHVVRPRLAALASVPLLTGLVAVSVAGLAVPGMIAAGGHTHAGAGHDHEAGAAAHAHDDGAVAEVASAVPAKPYDPALPIDLGGVEGVTPQQQAAAENLLSRTIVELPKFSDPAAIEAMGFQSIGDGALGHEHYVNVANMADDTILDPDLPESLVFDTTVTPKKLVSAMFMLRPGSTLADVPELGGKLTQWHIHDNLCFIGARVSSLREPGADCPAGQAKGGETPMLHVWIDARPGTVSADCGPFTALEGLGAGSVAEGETRACDKAHAHTP